MLSLGRNIRNITDDRDIPFKVNNELEKILNKYDKNFLSYIARLYEAIYGEKLDFTKLKSTIDALAKFNEKQEFNYLNNLLYPEKCIGCKIPSALPVPSCSFQLHNSIALKTNANGCLALHFNPFFLFSNVLDNQKNVYFNTNELQGGWETESKRYSSLFVGSGPSLNGHQTYEDWNCIDIGQMIPPVYNQYRLVSASIVVKYVGRLDIASGVIGGAIVFDETNEIGARLTVKETEGNHTYTYNNRPKYLWKYGNFNLAQDAFYWHENQCIEGIRLLYFPIDNSYEEYLRLMGTDKVKVSYTGSGPLTQSEVPIISTDGEFLRNGLGMFVYTLNAPPNSTCFKVDIFCNFECLPDNKFLNYMPVSVCPDIVTPIEKKLAIEEVQREPVTKAIADANSDKKVSFWRRVINKLQGKVPGINKLVDENVITSKPEMAPETIIEGVVSENIEKSEQNVENKENVNTSNQKVQQTQMVTPMDII